VVRQKLLLFMRETGDGENGRNPNVPSAASQATRASTEPTTTADSSLIEEVLHKETLTRAWKQVRANRGAPGVDGVTIEQFPAWYREHGAAVMQELREGRYRPSPVRRVDIPKPGGGTRTLGVPTVLDRLIQQAIVLVLTPILDPTFSPSSYGFRPGRSAHDAVRQARKYVAEGHRWVVDMDLSKFFDRVNHDILMERLARRIADKNLLRLIRRYLAAGMMQDGVVTERNEGTPQGGPLSPLLANLLLDEWDRELDRRGHRFCRYADDCNIYVRSRKAGQRVMAWCRKFLEGRLRLKVNEEKSAVDRPWNRKFLGLSITNGRVPKIRLAMPSVDRMQSRVREITARRRGVSIHRMVEELNRFLRGWLGYFRLAETPSRFEELDGWIRRRLRCFLMSQWKPGRGRRRALRRLGVCEAGNISWSRKGPWRLSKTQQTHQGLTAAYFRSLGLFSLLNHWRVLSQAN
jgi:RNA-directed DNA polymerase